MESQEVCRSTVSTMICSDCHSVKTFPIGITNTTMTSARTDETMFNLVQFRAPRDKVRLFSKQDLSPHFPATEKTQ